MIQIWQHVLPNRIIFFGSAARAVAGLAERQVHGQGRMRQQDALEGHGRSLVIVDECGGKCQHVVFDVLEQRGGHAGVPEQKVGRSHPAILLALRCSIPRMQAGLRRFNFYTDASASSGAALVVRRRLCPISSFPPGIASRDFRDWYQRRNDERVQQAKPSFPVLL